MWCECNCQNDIKYTGCPTRKPTYFTGYSHQNNEQSSCEYRSGNAFDFFFYNYR